MPVLMVMDLSLGERILLLSKLSKPNRVQANVGEMDIFQNQKIIPRLKEEMSIFQYLGIPWTESADNRSNLSLD